MHVAISSIAVDGLTAAIVLEDLVDCVFRASTINEGYPRFLEECDPVLAYVFEPDVAESARSVAMNTFVGICTDHGVPIGEVIICVNRLENR